MDINECFTENIALEQFYNGHLLQKDVSENELGWVWWQQHTIKLPLWA